MFSFFSFFSFICAENHIQYYYLNCESTSYWHEWMPQIINTFSVRFVRQLFGFRSTVLELNQRKHVNFEWVFFFCGAIYFWRTMNCVCLQKIHFCRADNIRVNIEMNMIQLRLRRIVVYDIHVRQINPLLCWDVITLFAIWYSVFVRALVNFLCLKLRFNLLFSIRFKQYENF